MSRTTSKASPPSGDAGQVGNEAATGRTGAVAWSETSPTDDVRTTPPCGDAGGSAPAGPPSRLINSREDKAFAKGCAAGFSVGYELGQKRALEMFAAELGVEVPK